MIHKKIGNLDSYIVFPNADNAYPENIVILTHGYGADGRDLISIAEEWAPNLPKTLFISPDAPYPCEASPFGRQWFSLENFTRKGK